MKEIFRAEDHILFHVKWQDRSHLQKYKHQLILPKNTYSPWESDKNFIKVFSKVNEEFTLVDKYRCYELWSLACQLKSKPGAILEVGVWRGGTGALLAAASEKSTNVYLCDTFEGVVKASEKDGVYKGGEHADTSIPTVEVLMKDLNITNYFIVKGIFPDESSHLIEENNFKICHIDVDVYQSAKDIFDWVWPKMNKGGVVVFDDYGFAACEGITQLVNELSESTPDCIQIYNINGHGILIKL